MLGFRSVGAVAIGVCALFALLPVAPAGASGSGPVSDDFNTPTLNSSVWSIENPAGDGSVSLTGQALALSVPAGSGHDLWSGDVNVLRVVQPVSNTDFDVEAKFDSLGSSRFQDQGIVVEQDATNLLRFDVFSDGSSITLFAASVSGATASVKVSETLASAQQPIWLRVRRVGDSWLYTYSEDGTVWSTAGSFTFALSVADLGPYAGNSGSPAPAWTSTVDYFHSDVDTPVFAANDDFSGASLNAATWGFVNPGGGAAQSMDGQHAVITVPAGSSHDPGGGGVGAPRLMQPIANGDFSVDAKFDSQVSLQFQEQGMIVEQDATHYVYVAVVQNWYQTALVVTSVSGATVTTNTNVEIYNKPSIVLRVARSGAAFSFGYSFDGRHWTAAASLVSALAPAQVGVFGGNFGGSSSPGFVTKVDYFVNSLAPPATEDGVAWPVAPAGPVISVWYGSQQTFGANGQPQQWVNVLGDVSDPSGIASLTYTLNGGTANALSLGENPVRLVEPGEFNVEVDAASLVVGANVVHLRAIDNVGNASTADVTVTKVNGGPWPLPYTADWSQAGGNINSVAQVADGHWVIQPDGTIHNTDFGYDRLVTIGQASTWAQYEVTAQVTINALDPDGAAVGIVAGWKGATSDLHGVVTPDQPRLGHPFPAAFLYGNGQGQSAGAQIYANTDAHPETALAADTTGMHMTLGQAYTFKARVTDNAVGGSDFRFKIWKTGTAEPSTWLVQASGDLSRGSIVLAAHRADVNFGTVTVTTVPNAPAIGTVTRGDSSAAVAFAPSTNDGGRAITGYTAACTSSNGGAATAGLGTSSPITVSGLSNGKSYTCTVTATNAIGAGPASIPSGGFVPARLPDAPAIGVATGANASAVVAFTAGADGGSAVTSFAATCTSGNGGATGSAVGVATPIVVSGLTGGATYTCVVSATNAVGASAISSASNPVVPVTEPHAPVITGATPGTQSIALAFTESANGGSAVLHFDAQCTSTNGGVTRTGTAPSSPLTVGGLTNGKQYTCTVTATNGIGTSASSAASSVVVPAGVPTAPTAVAAVPIPAAATVTWAAAAGNGAPVTLYSVRCSSSNGGVTRTAAAAASPATVAGLTNGRSYTCTVTATNAAGTSAASSPSNVFVPAAASSTAHAGYWMLGSDGHVYAFGSAKYFGSTTNGAVAMAARPDGLGYWITTDIGTVTAFGAAHADSGSPALLAHEHVSTISATPSGNGYWIFTDFGRVFPHGDAHFYGDMRAVQLNGPVVASAATPTGHGYYMIGTDGGVFAFGDAAFHGSMGATHLNRPIVGLSPTPDNHGYWLVASDGGVFAFDAPFRGSLGGMVLNQPVDGIVAYGNGYLMVASDGGVFDFSDKAFVGSLADRVSGPPIVGIVARSG